MFLLYTTDLARLAATHGLHVHLYADDTQVYGSCHTDGVAPLQDAVSTCVGDSDITVTETQTDTEMIDISKTHTETNTEKIFNTDTIYI